MVLITLQKKERCECSSRKDRQDSSPRGGDAERKPVLTPLMPTPLSPYWSPKALPSWWTMSDGNQPVAGLGQMDALLRLCQLGMVMFEPRAVKTRGCNWLNATRADSSGRVWRSQKENVSLRRGREGTDACREVPLHERGGGELCPPVWPGWSQVPHLDICQMAHCVLQAVWWGQFPELRPK